MADQQQGAPAGSGPAIQPNPAAPTQQKAPAAASNSGEITPEIRVLMDSAAATARKEAEVETRRKVKDETEAAALTEQGKFKELLTKEQQRAADLETQLRAARAESAARDMAAEVGIRADRAKHALLLIQSQIEFDAEDQPTNLEKLMKKVLKDMPEWAATAQPATPPQQGGDVTNPPRGERGAFSWSTAPRLGDGGLWKQ